MSRASALVTATNGSSPCYPNASTIWTPHRWANDDARPRLPRVVTHASLVHACSPVRLHVIQPEARRFVQSDAAWFKYVSKRGNHSQCVAALSAWRPRSCTLHDVHVWGPHRRLFRDSSYFMPPAAEKDQRARDAELSTPRAAPGYCSHKAAQTFGPVGGEVVRHLCFQAFHSCMLSAIPRPRASSRQQNDLVLRSSRCRSSAAT